ncbi:MAG TPA: carbon-nitrogen hydrolase family protein [Nocardioidaceae bacterium]|jgi:predicted amidohydrolase
MPRLLPLLVAQVESREPAAAVAGLREDVLANLEDFPETRLLVYPEYHCCRVSGGPKERAAQYDAMAEPLDGPRVEALREVAREAGVWLVPGTVIERGPAGELFNTALAISPTGELAGSYRKMFPWRPFEPFDPGTRFVTFDMPGVGRGGLCICYDLWFPEVIRHLAWLGAELVVVPTQTSTRDRAEELVLTQAAAIQNQVFVLGANAAAPVGTGRSLLVDPEGLVRFQAPSESAAYLTDVVDLDAVTRTRRFGSCGLNRMWSQPRPGDPQVELPMYGGTLDPARWTPAPTNGDGHDHP